MYIEKRLVGLYKNRLKRGSEEELGPSSITVHPYLRLFHFLSLRLRQEVERPGRKWNLSLNINDWSSDDKNIDGF